MPPGGAGHHRDGAHRHAPRCTAPVAAAALAMARSRRPLTSSVVSVRSGPGTPARRPATCAGRRPGRRCRRRRAAATPAARRRPAQRRLDLAGGHVRGDDERDVLLRDRVGRDSARRLDHRVAGGAEHVEVELGGARCGPAGRGRRAPGVQLAGVADQRPVGQRAAARTGRGARARARRPRPSASTPAPRATARAASTASAQSAGRPGPHQPAGSRVAGEDERDPARLGRHRRAATAAASRRSGRRVDAGDRAPRAAVGSGRVTRPDLEQRDVGAARGRRCGRSVSSRVGSSEVRISGCLLGQRVGQPQRAAPRVVGLAARAASCTFCADERVGEHLDEAVRRPARARPRRRTPLVVGEPAAAGAPGAAPTGSGRSRAGGRPPRRGRRRRCRSGRQLGGSTMSVAVAGVVDRRSRSSRSVSTTSCAVVAAGRPAGPGRSASSRTGARGRRRSTSVTPGRARPAAELDEQRARPARRRPAARSVSTPRSKRLRRLGGQLVPARAVRRPSTGSKCADSTSMSVVAPATSVVGAAHHAGEAERRLPAVGDQQVLGVQRAVDVVQRRELLARRAPGGRRSAARAARGRTRAAAGRARA